MSTTLHMRDGKKLVTTVTTIFKTCIPQVKWRNQREKNPEIRNHVFSEIAHFFIEDFFAKAYGPYPNFTQNSIPATKSIDFDLKIGVSQLLNFLCILIFH